eukprot:3475730-Rhodomonas_salina.6
MHSRSPSSSSTSKLSCVASARTQRQRDRQRDRQTDRQFVRNGSSTAVNGSYKQHCRCERQSCSHKRQHYRGKRGQFAHSERGGGPSPRSLSRATTRVISAWQHVVACRSVPGVVSGGRRALLPATWTGAFR